MKKLISALLVSLMAVGVSGCNTKGTVQAQAEQTQATTKAVAVESTTQKETEKKLSGKVVVYCPSPAGLADKMAAQFKEKTGVAVEMFQGTTGEILARLEAEKANPVADVVIMASWADGLSMVAQDKVLSYEAKNSDKLVNGWVDKDHKIYGYSASAMGVIYNTKAIPELKADWNELGSNPKYKGMIAIPDPVKSGSCKDFLSGYVNAFGDNGQKVIDSWVTNG
jgi:iron(III) transport system substrate-binding protein